MKLEEKSGMKRHAETSSHLHEGSSTSCTARQSPHSWSTWVLEGGKVPVGRISCRTLATSLPHVMSHKQTELELPLLGVWSAKLLWKTRRSRRQFVYVMAWLHTHSSESQGELTEVMKRPSSRV